MDEKRIVSSEEIGKRIKARRRELGLSQEALATIIDVSYQQVQRYESGKNSLNVEKLQEVAKALSVPVSYLLCPDKYDGSPLEDHGEKELISHYRKVQHSEIKALVVRLTNMIARWEEYCNSGGHL
jgi:transcriptional regulator with XRE-family HTH domain